MPLLSAATAAQEDSLAPPPPIVRSVPVRVRVRSLVIVQARLRSPKMWDDTADMPFEQRFIAHRTVPVGPAALELEQTPPTMGGTDPLGTACTCLLYTSPSPRD